jgi:hypothetical protein
MRAAAIGSYFQMSWSEVEERQVRSGYFGRGDCDDDTLEISIVSDLELYKAN